MTQFTPDPQNGNPAPPLADPDAVATPEGDNEFAPDQPLKPLDGEMRKPPAVDTNKV